MDLIECVDLAERPPAETEARAALASTDRLEVGEAPDSAAARAAQRECEKLSETPCDLISARPMPSTEECFTVVTRPSGGTHDRRK